MQSLLDKYAPLLVICGAERRDIPLLVFKNVKYIQVNVISPSFNHADVFALRDGARP